MGHLPDFDFGTFFGNGVSASIHTVLGRDCRGRPQGDYFYGCQVHVRLLLWVSGTYKTTSMGVRYISEYFYRCQVHITILLWLSGKYFFAGAIMGSVKCHLFEDPVFRRFGCD